MKYIVKPALTLFITAVIVVAALSVVYNFTKEPIERQKRKTQETVLKQVIPQASLYTEIETEKKGSMSAVFKALAGNEIIGYIVQLSPEGYSGKIDFLVGFSASQNYITGLRVMRHTETPGFGSKVLKEKFYGQYNYLPLSPLKVVRNNPGPGDIQAITSATITTKAITNAVNEAIEWYLEFISEDKEEE
ncbi:MAG: RnfABCDGE type electron transport complex subunit G [Treponema sp.]|nr:RnfABCDGE type electron transport complex subunit G [Treponema sp.]MCL2237682.1 RnfABCDGE type electron transport complex subunit G [Treponema sp.]